MALAAFREPYARARRLCKNEAPDTTQAGSPTRTCARCWPDLGYNQKMTFEEFVLRVDALVVEAQPGLEYALQAKEASAGGPVISEDI